MSDYTPPIGNNVTLNLQDAASPPGGDSVVLNLVPLANGTIYPSGIAPGGIGTPTIQNLRQYVSPSGLNTSAHGTATVINKNQWVQPLGFSGAIGTPSIRNQLAFLPIVGFSQLVFGSPTIYNRNRTISITGFMSAALGSVRAEHARRTLLQSGASMGGIGTPTIGNLNRTIQPASIFTNFASAHMVGGTRYILAVGFNAAKFGTRIIPEIQTVYPQGFTGIYSQPTVWNRTQTVRPQGFLTVGTEPAQRWGWAYLYNKRQYITQVFDINSGLVPPSWPQWTKIENRSRAVSTFGQSLTLFGYPSIDNKARPLLPAGIAAPSAPEYYKAGMVAYRVRSLVMDGLEPPYISGWSVVHNDARLLAPAGFVASQWGYPFVANNRRYFSYIGAFNAAVYGTPMVAYRERTLTFEGRFTIAAPTIPLPVVKLHTRYVDGVGYDASRYGAPALTIHRNLITPRWTLKHYFGEPAVWNKTPELRTRGRASDEFGDTSIRLQWRPVSAFGSGMQLFGRTEIAYRDRRITLNGISNGLFGLNTVTKMGSPPYSLQRIVLDATETSSGNGIPPPEGEGYVQVPPPTLNQLVVYPAGIDAAKYGLASVTANTIRVEPGYYDLAVGEPTVSLKIRTVAVSPFPSSQVFDPSEPRLSPHTIWAVYEAPEQAQINHPTLTRLHPVDGLDREPGAIFGEHTITLKNRRITTLNHSNSMASYGKPDIFNRRSYILPTGISTQRFGWHVVPGTQTVEVFDSVDSMIFGQPIIAPPPYLGPQTIYAAGFNANVYGGNQIELFNREVHPAGFDALQPGTKKFLDNPYMWQGLRVGPLMPTIPEGKDMNLFGTQWISHRVRNLSMDGFDSFRCEYQLEAFDKRMRITRRAATIPSQTVTPVGFVAFSSAASNVRLGARYIRPDGNSDQFRKGAPH